MKIKKRGVPRREFLRSTALLGAGMAVTGCAVRPSKRGEVRGVATAPATFQYIIVGAGAGGGPLAVSLARAGFDVLLIDAGGDRLPDSARVPALHPASTEDPEISWDYTVRQQESAVHLGFEAGESGKDQGQIWYPRSSGIGGCTMHNAMIAMYPHPDDWKKIAQASGDPSWSPAQMRKIYLDRIERRLYLNDQKGWHPLEMNQISVGVKDPQLRKLLLSAAGPGDIGSILGGLLRNGRISAALDVNDEKNLDREGLFMIPKSTYGGVRYGVHEYVMENRGRTSSGGSLTVQPHTLVKRVVFEKQTEGRLRAAGVETAIGERLYRAHRDGFNQVREEKFFRAEKEVILSAGAFNTPQLLMLSGIGSTEFFETPAARGIPKNLVLEGVGGNLQDRYEVTVVSQFPEDFSFVKDCSFETEASDPCFADWLRSADKKKTIYSSNGVVAGIKMRSSVHKRQGLPQDLVIFGAPGDFRGYVHGYSKTATAKKNIFSWAILKGYSRNRSGQVKLKSNDFRDTPDIDFRYFNGQGAEEDLQAVYEGVQKARELNRELGHKIPRIEELFPKTSVADENIKTWIKREAWGHHASCTAKMGRNPADGSVVDFDFKVHGTSNLRVVDASVFPEIPGLFIVVPVYMIAEKAADVIIREGRGSGGNG